MEQFKTAIVYGKSVKHQPQRVGLAHELEDEDEESGSSSKPLRTTFELNETLYAEAELEDTDTVYLWLGVRSDISLICCP